MSDSVELDLGTQRLTLLPSRAAWWPAARALLIADLHLGKAEAIFAHGAPLSADAASGILDEQLRRLSAAANACPGLERILILGDLLHAPAGITGGLLDRVAAWRDTFTLPIELIPGNHDRHLHRVLDAWRITLRPEVVFEHLLVLRHDPAPDARGPVVCGHVHPAVRLGNRGETLKLPCFWRTREAPPRQTECRPQNDREPQRQPGAGDILVLPAFTLFASGAVIDLRRGDQVTAIAGDRVVRVAGD